MRDLTNEEQLTFDRLRRKIFERASRNNLRSRFVEGEERLRATGFTIPPGMEQLQVALNWPAKVVSAFTSRQVPSGFISSTGTSLLTEVEDVYADNHFESVERWAIQSANQHGCAFVFANPGDAEVGEPDVVLTVRTALTATAETDPRSRRVTAALEIIDHDTATLYLPGVMLNCVMDQHRWRVENEWPLPTQLVPCAPYVSGASAEKPFGSSRVSNTVMDLTYQGARTLLRQEVAAEFYSAPRLALMGADDSIFTDPVTGRRVSPLDILTGAIWAIPDVNPEEAEEFNMDPRVQRMDVQQIHQASMQPFSDQFRVTAANLAAASSIPLQYLGVVSDSNPSSAEAIRALENDLVYEVRAQFPSLNMGRKMLVKAILSVKNGELGSSALADLRGVTPEWEDPTTRSVSDQSNYVDRQVAAGNIQGGGKVALSLLPMSQGTREAALAENERAAGAGLMEQILQGAEGGDDAERARAMKDQFDALGVAIRAGVDPDDAAQRVGLAGIKFTGAVPAMLRMPEREAAQYEDG